MGFYWNADFDGTAHHARRRHYRGQHRMPLGRNLIARAERILREMFWLQRDAASVTA